MKETLNQLLIAFKLFIVLTILLGFLYPMLVTLIAQVVFPWKANGSILLSENKKIGSALIGQYFKEEKYFWGRPSATARFPYDAENSSGSNLALSNLKEISLIKERVENLKRSNHENVKRAIPIDLVTASGSGLDPEISLASAYYQIPRIARVRSMAPKEVEEIVQHLSRGKSAFSLGPPRVNVLQLNLNLDHITVRKAS